MKSRPIGSRTAFGIGWPGIHDGPAALGVVACLRRMYETKRRLPTQHSTAPIAGRRATPSRAWIPDPSRQRLARLAPLPWRAPEAPLPRGVEGMSEERRRYFESTRSQAPDATGIPGALRAKMEAALGADFSGVRVHTGSTRAVTLGALSYTQGSEIHMAPGQWAPETSFGQALLGHELSHVVQQREGRVKATSQIAGVALNDELALEAEAEAMGARAARGDAAQQRRVPPIREASTGVTQLRRGDHAKPSQIKTRRGITDRIDDAYGAGSLSDKQWRSQLGSAKQALVDGDAAEAAHIYLTLYKDIAELAQANLVLFTASSIHQVTDTEESRTGMKPGLNFSLEKSTEAEGRTGYVNDQGDFGVGLSFTPDVPQPQVAIVLYRNAFEPEKERTLWVMRHELTHAEHDEDTLSTVEKWLKTSKAKAGSKVPPKARFLEWLRQQRGLSKVDLALIEESAVNLVAGSPNTEILSHAEGFMTAFHLTSPAPTDANHPVFIELLGVLENNKGTPRWALADPSIRSEALGRLQEYYCHALGRSHREAFDGWVNYQLDLVRRDQFLRGEYSSEQLSDETLDVFASSEKEEAARVSAAKREKTMHKSFVRGLEEIIKGKCKGINPSMAL
jgi:hypothetical protein